MTIRRSNEDGASDSGENLSQSVSNHSSDESKPEGLRHKLEQLREYARRNGIRGVSFSMLLHTNRAMTASESVDFVMETSKASVNRLEELRKAALLDSPSAGFAPD